MRTYEEIRSHQEKPFQQAVQDVEAQCRQLAAALAARREEHARLLAAIKELESKQQALGAPQATVRREMAELEQEGRRIQQALASRLAVLREQEQQAEAIAEDVRRQRRALASIQGDIGRRNEEIERTADTIEEARRRVLGSHVHALRAYLGEAFAFLEQSAIEAGARKEHERLRTTFDEARQNDPELARLHAERLELQGLRQAAQTATVRELLGRQLRDVEDRLGQRFPGLLTAPAPPKDEVVDTFSWYEPDDDLTYVLLPLPASVWHSLPAADDPLGPTMCRALWSFVQAHPDPAPSVESVSDFVVLEFHGDRSWKLGEDLIDFMGSQGSIKFLVAPLPAELRQALSDGANP